MIAGACALLAAAALGASTGAADGAARLDEIFRDRDATFVLYDANAGTYHRHDPERAAVRLSPCSTFKIPNSLIGLETGVVEGAETLKRWDPEKHPCTSQSESRCRTLSRDHTLRSALQASVVWYYQELAVDVGEDAMTRWLEKLEYGNRDISSGLDRFWLSGSLRISADEQIAFLRRFHAGGIASERSTAVVKDILTVEETDAYRLSAKTGLGHTPEGRPLGWYVGYVERGEDGTYFFALNVEADDWDEVIRNRVPRAREALAAFGLVEANAR